MARYNSGCIICGKPLEYYVAAKSLTCFICGALGTGNAACEDTHYVCDACHAQKAYEHITGMAMASQSNNPVFIATEAMRERFINMHGPEHHYLVSAALLCAYHNAGGKIDLESALATARQRTGKVPGGSCGLWGACGAAIGAGIFFSIITKATPLSDRKWRLANLLTSECLRDIAQNGGVRCCKRDTFLTLNRAVGFIKEHLEIAMEAGGEIICSFYAGNPSCKKRLCLFFPVR